MIESEKEELRRIVFELEQMEASRERICALCEELGDTIYSRRCHGDPAKAARVRSKRGITLALNLLDRTREALDGLRLKILRDNLARLLHGVSQIGE